MIGDLNDHDECLGDVLSVFVVFMVCCGLVSGIRRCPLGLGRLSADVRPLSTPISINKSNEMELNIKRKEVIWILIVNEMKKKAVVLRLND